MKEEDIHGNGGASTWVGPPAGKVGQPFFCTLAASATLALSCAAADRLRWLKHVKWKEVRSAVGLVCGDANAVRFAEVIRGRTHTGWHGDGRLLAVNVECAINIRTGEEVEKAP